ncbi:adenylate/guanylate cyclase domain-containing protein [Leptospira ognonensis]|uniref:Adenylate/guanylate cyclase domain-containing protein n=1 Tax=Leptospira ognonensis TaxID=2484945 RepID=A0A4R9K0J1_9LEPT|nr:adenylate/guanylate cyclase domain-containing protein [Leptospira ognonensis]TGL58526.1 adenylate/guanylate cyclase domain-containing protein [Leptospira ognonensis]
MTRYRKFVDWLKVTGATRGLSEQDARAVRTTAWVQILMFSLPTLLIVPTYFTEPPETHIFTYATYFPLVVPLVIARYLLIQQRLAAAAILTLVASDYHLVALSIAQADDPAPMGFLLLGMLSFVMVPRQHVITRWSLVIVPMGLFLFFQYYYRSLGKSGIFGPAHLVVPADYLMPPLTLLIIFFILITYQFVKAVNGAEDRLAAELAKSEKLLLNILPREVANELKMDGTSKPRHFPSATVCFTDFEGFTKIAETLKPEELVAELDRCFSYFDSLMDRYNLEKLKTIGDSYMFAGGIPQNNATHAVDCVMAALEIQAFMNRMKEIKADQNLPYWQLRLGIHSGDLVAGVIGERKFAYDVWSDTVNTASRCESSGASGKINISGVTFELIKDFFACEYRGAMPAKNKGQIDMYFVQGLLPELQRPGHERTPNVEFEKRYRRLREQQTSS